MATEIVANARLELLRGLAAWRDHHEAAVRDGKWDPDFCRLVPLWEGEWANSEDDIRLAVRECVLLGEVEQDTPLHAVHRMIWPDGFVAITDLGYSRIRAHDVIHETAQEAPCST